MSPNDVLEVGRESILVLLKLGTPVMLAALFVGITVSFIQALTQIQEVTLSFIPKIFATFATMLILMPFFGRTLDTFTRDIFDRIIGLN